MASVIALPIFSVHCRIPLWVVNHRETFTRWKCESHVKIIVEVNGQENCHTFHLCQSHSLSQFQPCEGAFTAQFIMMPQNSWCWLTTELLFVRVCAEYCYQSVWSRFGHVQVDDPLCTYLNMWRLKNRPLSQPLNLQAGEPSSGSRGGGPRGPWPPPGPVKIGHKKDGRRRRPHRFHVSRPPPYPAAGSATGTFHCSFITCLQFVWKHFPSCLPQELHITSKTFLPVKCLRRGSNNLNSQNLLLKFFCGLFQVLCWSHVVKTDNISYCIHTD